MFPMGQETCGNMMGPPIRGPEGLRKRIFMLPVGAIGFIKLPISGGIKLDVNLW